jgi:xanthine dehydrogenase accessory factor
MREFLDRVAALAREGASFAVATVVARRAPVSAHLGDRAIVFADGRMEGFVGGACSHEIIRRQGLDALRTRTSRLVSIRPDASETATSGEHVVVPMTCVSEGAVDVYVEPFLQARRLVVVGATPVAGALARLARTMEYRVVRVVESHERRDIEAEATSLGITVIDLDAIASALQDDGAGLVAVVASQGHYDEPALTAILKHQPAYVGLVASRKRGATVRADLEAAGVTGVETISNPAGLDLGARIPAEVALSILAEIVQRQPSGARVEAGVNTPAVAAISVPATAVDPVCQMTVEVATARHTAALDGVTYYFCCPHCRARFVKEPHVFLGKGA